MAKSKPTKIISKKHLARLERERQQTAIITFVAIGVLVIVVGLIGYGALYDTVLQARQPIVRVNNDVMDTQQFQVWVRITRQNMINEYLQYYQLAQMFGSDPSTDPTITSLTNELNDPSTVGNQVIQSAEDSFIIRQYAKAHGIGGHRQGNPGCGAGRIQLLPEWYAHPDLDRSLLCLFHTVRHPAFPGDPDTDSHDRLESHPHPWSQPDRYESPHRYADSDRRPDQHLDAPADPLHPESLPNPSKE